MKILLILMYFIPSFFCYGEGYDLSLILNNGEHLMLSVDKEIEILTIREFYVKKIYGLENLEKLKVLLFDSNPYIDDFNFLDEINNLDIVVFRFIVFDNLDFLEGLNINKGLIFQSCTFNFEKINFPTMEIEYLELSNCHLITAPIIETNELQVLNLAYNNITKLTQDAFLLSEIKVILKGNPTEEKDLGKFSYEDLQYSVPYEYKQFIQ